MSLNVSHHEEGKNEICRLEKQKKDADREGKCP